MSPAEEIAEMCVNKITFGLLHDFTAVFTLGLLEVGIALSLIFDKSLRIGLLFFFFHMLGTITPFLFFPELCFEEFPSFTLLGQYIVKNIVFVVIGLFIWRKYFS